jgi:hypothetical protein
VEFTWSARTGVLLAHQRVMMGAAGTAVPCEEWEQERATFGRTRIDEAAKTAARKALRSGKGIIKVAKELGLGVGTVHRIKLEMDGIA